MEKSAKLKRVLIWLAVGRTAVGILAIVLAKFLYEDHFLWLVLMRPTKEVILAGAFLAKKRTMPGLLIQIVIAAIPLSILGVWLSYYLGRLHAGELGKEKLPGVAGRVLPAKRIRKLQRVLQKKGSRLVVLGRLAAFPSTLVGAAAGSSDMQSRKFLPADAIGAVGAIAEVMAVGYLLGSFFDPADPKTSWLVTGIGVAVVFILFFLLGRYLHRE